MKRSNINRYLREAEAFFARHHFLLPPFAQWSAAECRANLAAWPELKECQLGWDITDFGRDDFERIGLLLFTLRNGRHGVAGAKPYAEKIMITRVDQLTLLHCHVTKTEDIINRAGGRLCFKLYNRIGDKELADTPVTVFGDGRPHIVPAGGVISIGPGESLTLTPGLFHAFWAESEDVMVGEVSAVNDDHNDNVFYEEQRRFPQIDEDEQAVHLLVSDY